MAPRKRKAEEGQGAAAARVTRKSTRLANSSSALPPPESPKKKKGKANAKKEKAKPEKKDEAEKNETEVEKEVVVEDVKRTAVEGTTKTIVVEHCKQCNRFKTRAIKVKEDIEAAVPGVSVLLNPDKPRRGCFEIREKDGETFISLLDLKRPFKPMTDLDMDKVISDIVQKIKS